MNDTNFMLIFKKYKWVLLFCLFVLIAIIAVVAVIGGLKNTKEKTSENDSSLAAQVEVERGEIEKAFKERFEFLGDGRIEIKKIVLLGDGTYAGLLSKLYMSTYRAILLKTDEGWSVVGIPAMMLYYGDFPEVPENIIYAINNLEVDDEK